jgi:predicted N-acyltransferase
MVGGARATLPALVLVAPGYCGDPAGACADDPVAIQEFLSGVLGWCEEHGLAGLHILYTASPAVSEAVRGLGGASYPITSRFALPVWWDDWAGYLRGLPAKRAREVSREVRRAGESGAAPAVVDPASCFGALLAGRCDLLRRHGQEVDEAAERHRLHGLIAVFGGRLRVYGAVERGDVVASSVCLRHGKTMNVIFSGTTERGHMLPFAHFLATYYAPAMYSTRGELDEIDYGIGHGVGKLLRGCGARQLYAHAFGVGQQRHYALAQAVRLLAGGAGPGQGPAGPGRPAGPTQEKVRLSWT